MTRTKIDATQRTVLITGCSTGIGRECAIDLADRGWIVFAGVRNQIDGQKLQASIGSSLLPVQLDVTKADEIQAAVQLLVTHLGDRGLDALVNNAGIVVPGPLELVSSSQLRRQFEVNVIGTHAVTASMLPLLRNKPASESASGLLRPRLVFVGSISGRVTPPYYGAYAASKHALEAFADAWRSELREWRIAVSMIQPDSIATQLWDKVTTEISDLSVNEGTGATHAYADQLRLARRSSLSNGRGGLPTSRVVAAVRHALESPRPKSHYPVGWRTLAAFWAKAILPSSVMDLVMRKAVSR